jgi:formate/nitrite transporter FocA (FNT family)
VAEAELSVRPTAAEILERVLSDAESEVDRPLPALALSGLAAGLTMGFTGLGVAASFAAFGHGPWQHFAAYLIYPIGFVAVIIGRQQLYTENTLYPVALVLDRHEYLRRTLVLWTVVFWANIAGVIVFAALVTKTHALPHDIQQQLAALGSHAVDRTFAYAFFSGIVGGWLIALVAWLLDGTDGGVSMIVLIWLLTFLVGLAGLAHCIASSAEILAAVMAGRAGLGEYALWLTAATIGNTVGGVVIVALLNYGQVMAGGKDPD